MKRFEWAIAGLFFLFSAGAGWATTIPLPDPTMIIVRGDPTPQPVFGTSFTFSSNANGGGALEFRNESSIHCANLLVTTQVPGNPPITDLNQYFFGGNAYTNHLATIGGSTLSIFWFDAPLANQLQSIGAGQLFTIILNDDHSLNPDGFGGWGPNHPFLAQANIPEPGTYLLVLSGLIGMVAGSRIGRSHQKR